MFRSKSVAARRFIFGAFLVWLACGTAVLAKSQLITPSVSWLASSVPDSARIQVSKIVETDSTAQMKFTTQGSCAVKGKFLATTKVGTCRIELRLSATPKFAATTSVAIVRVKKKTELNVLAAASLANPFETLGEIFTRRFMNVSVRFNFAGSATLAMQIQQGAPVDIVAMADTANMKKVLVSGDVERKSVITLVRNQLAILVQRGNPQKINSLNDLARSGLKVVLCDLAQPCGKYAATVLSKANVSFTVASREASASGVVLRVGFGEADAGIAYITDGIVAGDKVDAVKIADILNLIAEYPIGVATKPTTKDTAAIVAFMAMTKSSVGRTIFAENGFILP
ncbi:MAG: molybdate ABC transporter substrate-binding protein [Actinomycetota bacterium]|nr:molybdate ABC transporter substrate-binding protein [Actinomycetota bacterium]